MEPAKFMFFVSCAFNFFCISIGEEGPLTLLVSFDGFRWDYVNKVETPNFDQLIADGAFVPDGIVNTFITKTFPNHFTLATGMWEESHGIVANNMYDPLLNEHFHIGDEDAKDGKWWDTGAEPIWVTNQLQGGRSGVYYWPGSESEIKGIRPNHYKNYSTDTPFSDRVDGVLEWFTGEDPVDVGLLYFNEPDHSGHVYGPDAPEMLNVIRMCDDTAGYLIKRLKEENLYDKINVIITSDHGMAELDMKKRVIVLENYINLDLFEVVDDTPVAAIRPFDNKNIVTIYNALHDKHPNLTVYLKEDIPEKFHYQKNSRIMPIILVADEGWSIASTKAEYMNSTQHGGHGYDNRYKSMHPFFIAHGPAFKSNFTSKPFNNVDVYPLICHIMGLQPGPNNGSLNVVNDMLIASVIPVVPAFFPYHLKLSQRLIIAIIFAGSIALIAAILLTGMCVRQRKYRLKNYRPDLPATNYEGSKPLLSEQDEDIA
ncbi:ectonucleotide pyrophosphatase/phosphodiesterase family member 5-like [Saccoglossus kowalevskii]|uniref:Ectonucleotide pyrophosphatase/phosphodiesterase family member 5-like n=1 Tax=Saccoglossus kowalevskii TaxID=10224 RepID=A0ABM0M562_SACKO|nr:PREDICTED: ectonucleotide pyrophosphatase/phosphodiesterase family member 5-like [Saccoglossus kowalevskii]